MFGIDVIKYPVSWIIGIGLLAILVISVLVLVVLSPVILTCGIVWYLYDRYKEMPNPAKIATLLVLGLAGIHITRMLLHP